MEELIHFKLNGNAVRKVLDGERTLLWVLRTDLKLTGIKYGCGKGLCGACTVLVNNKAARACQIPIKNIRGKDLLTIEGLAKNGKLHPIQKAFIKHNALQCGFCTPGMILNAYGLLKESPRPSYREVLQGMDNNFCRCGSHKRIVMAILTASRVMDGGEE